MLDDHLFTYAAPKLWNALPLAIRYLNTITGFKGKLTRDPSYMWHTPVLHLQDYLPPVAGYPNQMNTIRIYNAILKQNLAYMHG